MSYKRTSEYMCMCVLAQRGVQVGSGLDYLKKKKKINLTTTKPDLPL